MLPRLHRLRRSQDIVHVLKTGRRLKRGPVSVYTRSSSHPYSRYTCIVGKKVSNSAVVRHRVQRWLREVGRELIAQQATSQDIVIVAYSGILSIKSLSALKQSILG